MDQNTLRWINFAFEVLQALAVLFALWLASGIALELFVSGGSEDEDEFDGHDQEGSAMEAVEAEGAGLAGWQPRFGRGLAIVAWLVLSGLFYLPLSDIITGLRTAVFLGIGWTEMGLSPAFNSFGSIPQNYYFLWTLIVLVVVYALALWVGRRAFTDRPGSLFEDLPFSSIERTFMLLGAAGLVHFLVSNLLTTLTWIDLPNQTAQPQGGALLFLAPALVGLLLLLLLVVWMNASLLREEIQMDEEVDEEQEAFEDEAFETLEGPTDSSLEVETAEPEGDTTGEVEADEDESQAS